MDIRMSARTFGIMTNRGLNTDHALTLMPAYRENIIQLRPKNHISTTAIGDLHTSMIRVSRAFRSTHR